MQFTVAVRNNHFPRMGELVELDDEAQQDWAFEIAKGFLVPVSDPTTVPAPAPQIGEAVDYPREQFGGTLHVPHDGTAVEADLPAE
jgi:hypothetical protein